VPNPAADAGLDDDDIRHAARPAVAKLKTAAFHDAFVHGKLVRMKLRLLAHCLVLALFITASVLTAFVSPAKAGYDGMDAEAAMPMAVDMPCCPSDRDKSQDCTTNCPALSFCLAKCFASEPAGTFVILPRSIVAVLGLAGDDATRASRPFEPPARPPRTQGIAGA
jgi:hypothetical protein